MHRGVHSIDLNSNVQETREKIKKKPACVSN